MFDVPSLKSLRSLKLDSLYFASFGETRVPIEHLRDEGNRLISAIGANCCHLENLELQLECCTSWLKCFAKLRCLKSIKLLVGFLIGFDDYDGTVPR